MNMHQFQLNRKSPPDVALEDKIACSAQSILSHVLGKLKSDLLGPESSSNYVVFNSPSFHM